MAPRQVASLLTLISLSPPLRDLVPGFQIVCLPVKRYMFLRTIFDVAGHVGFHCSRWGLPTPSPDRRSDRVGDGLFSQKISAAHRGAQSRSMYKATWVRVGVTIRFRSCKEKEGREQLQIDVIEG